MLNNYKDFDNVLIAYYRILLYHFIEKNKNKMLSENFPISLVNLLPPEFIDNVDSDSFYHNYLFKIYKEAERIVIYLTPYILGFNIELIAIKEITDIFHNYKAIIVDADGLNDENNKNYYFIKKYIMNLFILNYFLKLIKGI